ncbi:glycosyltransferase family 39 protein [Streptomyces brasiliensis]|uniref:glycosyltransferase family 39 protein n=1 Tax=Streptomyces brasiliensis TaxID=1954 RepID=UPI00227D94C4|nr:glycosyltransferase family 39 protein [Streptomyces brasiliensis]
MTVPAGVMLAVGLWGVDRGGMWRDEAVTFQVARRTVPQIWRLLHGVDAVHGLYYLFMHAVLAVRPGEVPLRLPSVCAAAATAGLVAALGTRLGRPRVGLWAGLLYAVTPMVGHYAQEGRSYALVAAGAAGATLLLVRAVGSASGGAGRSWWAYGVVLGVTCLLHELAVLLLLAHAVTLGLARVGRRVWRGWACAAGVVVVVLLPMVAVSRAQSAQLAWVREPDMESAQELLRAFVGPASGVYWTCLVLAGMGLSRVVGRRAGELTCAGVGAPLAVVPPVMLMLMSQVAPLYVDRYVLYALAGAPLVVAAGADRVAGVVGRLRPVGRRVPTLPHPRLRSSGETPLAPRDDSPHDDGTSIAQPPPKSPHFTSPLVTLTGALAIACAFVHQLPLLREDRSPDHRPDNLAAVSTVAARELRPGDPVLFLPSHTRATALAYPGAFRGTRDVALAVTAPASGTLYGTEVDADVLRRRLAGIDRVWVVAARYLLDGAEPRRPADRLKLAVLNERFALSERFVRDRVELRLYVRRTLATDSPVLPAGPPRPAPR